MMMLAAAALIVGTGGALGAWLLLRAIAVATNLFWFGRLSAAPAAITDNTLGIGVIAVPVIGSLIVGVVARYGSEGIVVPFSPVDPRAAGRDPKPQAAALKADAH